MAVARRSAAQKFVNVFYSRLENKHCSWWRPRRTFQLFKTYVFLSREIDSRPGNEGCLRRAFQIYKKKVSPLQHFQRKRWAKHRKPLLNRLWLLLSQMRRERCIGRNKWLRVPISKLRSSSGRRQGRGGDNCHRNNAEQHETNSRKAHSSSPPDSSQHCVEIANFFVM